MKIISWNLNSRTNKDTLKSQCDYLRINDFDLITLQEVTLNSEKYFKSSFQDRNIISSFDLVKDKSILIKKRKYGQLIISKSPIEYLDDRCDEIPFEERVLSGYIPCMQIEIHTTHVPPGSSNGIIKVQHFEGLFKYLQGRKNKTKILTGDFNSPKDELSDGTVITWGQKINSSGKIRFAVNPKWKDECTGERWDSAERNIIERHYKLGLEDVFRSLNGYEVSSGSWFTLKGIGRRYDHIFCSKSLDVSSSFYDHEPRLNKLSDHSPIVCMVNL
ncbi:endonuclease/exonuclease/phosphatase family protein [Gammaproteobacteria bacterium]|nr:endonuclease/exonuclease/phosphatase family protein [Gammaproteobacteria bacterium]